MDSIKLTKSRSIGLNEPPYIIAEIGNNHNGSLDMAKKLIKISKDIGVDAVKFQVKDIETAFDKKLLDSPYNNENSFGSTYREHKQALESCSRLMTTTATGQRGSDMLNRNMEKVIDHITNVL